MRQTWNDTHYSLRPTNQPIVSQYKDRITLAMPGWDLDGHGFAIDMGRAQLPTIEKLAAALRALPPLPSESAGDPFAEDDACPLCPKTTEQLGFPCKACTALEAYSADH